MSDKNASWHQSEFPGPPWLAMYHQLRSTGLFPWLWRLFYEFRRRSGLERLRYPPGRVSAAKLSRWLMGRGDFSDLPKRLRSDRRRRFPLVEDSASLREPLRRQFGQQLPQLLGEADRLVDGVLRLRGWESIDLRTPIAWTVGPDSGKRWPDVHWTLQRPRTGSPFGDPKVVWELNRHQFFLILGRAYAFTGQEKYARCFADLVDSWIRQNPPEMGINWASNLELSVRAISWLWSLRFFLDSDALVDELLGEMLAVLAVAGRHILRDINYSWYSMRNNHLIGDAAGLVLLGNFLPELREAERWRRTGLRILYSQIDKQVLPDGVDHEQAISYHRFVWYFYLLACLSERRRGGRVPPKVFEYLRKMAEFVAWMRRPDGTVCNVGDQDNAKVVFLSNESFDRYDDMLSTAAVLFEQGELKYLAGRLSEETFHLLGPQSLEIWRRVVAREPRDNFRVFRDGGYCFWRSGFGPDDDYLMFRCGPTTGHGHADQLHVELALRGRNFLCDIGTYQYNCPLPWRNYFRATRGHNTIRIDHQSQTVPHWPFRWLLQARGELLRCVCRRDFALFDGQHDGYKRFSPPVVHRRAVLLLRGRYVLVFDAVLGTGEHEIDIMFHFPPVRVELDRSCGAAVTRVGDGNELAIISSAGPEWVRNLVSGSEQPIDGWFSQAYGVKHPAPVLHIAARKVLPVLVATLLVGSDGRRPMPRLAPLEVRAARGPVVAVAVERDEGRDIVVNSFAAAPQEMLVGGCLEVVGLTGWAAMDKRGRLQESLAVDASAIRLVGR